MSDVIQWAVVAACVIAAAVCLARRFRKSARGECDKSCCGSCGKRDNCDTR